MQLWRWLNHTPPSIPSDLLSNFTSLPPTLSPFSFPASLRAPTLDLASKHLVCSVALTGVMLFQAGRWWAERDNEQEDTEGLRGTESRSDSRAGELPSEATTPEIPQEKVVGGVEVEVDKLKGGSLKSK